MTKIGKLRKLRTFFEEDSANNGPNLKLNQHARNSQSSAILKGVKVGLIDVGQNEQNLS